MDQHVQMVSTVASLVLAAWYYVLLQARGWQATLGKRLVGIYVIGVAGNEMGFRSARIRFFASIPSVATLGIGFLMAGWTPQKTALHDKLAGPRVVRGRV